MDIKDELQLSTDLGLTINFVVQAKLAAAQSAIIFKETDLERRRRIIKSTKQYIKSMSEFSDYFNARYAAAPNNEWYLIPDALDCTREITKAKTKLKYLTSRHPQGVSRKSYDIAAIKQIPIDTLVEVNRAGFFRVREGDKTPSCKWYKDKNTWHDFGSDEGGDVIDLYQKLNKCTLIQALRALSSNS